MNEDRTGEDYHTSQVSKAIPYLKDSCERDVLPALTKYMGKIPPYSPRSCGSSFNNVSSDS